MTRSARCSLPGTVSSTHKTEVICLTMEKKNLGIRVDFKKVNQQWSPITNKVGVTLGHANENAACQYKDIFMNHSETEIDGLEWSFLGSFEHVP